mmetsp:Transcript_27557/g.74695  ORF Transcript_27557/g.74695 Transcript_27557/m.74695 type:complete len:109 (-) Transcript_27557:274-600(-)
MKAELWESEGVGSDTSPTGKACGISWCGSHGETAEVGPKKAAGSGSCAGAPYVHVAGGPAAATATPPHWLVTTGGAAPLYTLLVATPPQYWLLVMTCGAAVSTPPGSV